MAGPPGDPGRFCWAEALGVVVLSALAVFLLVVSWRRWNHPLIDFGRELYIPWRLSEGAVLYRDVDDVYGPLSQYINGALFRVFGPGLMVLVTANLVILLAIVALSYGLFRRAWGATGALAASAAFVAVFAFNQSFYLSNFNYVTPYAHEATHGVLVCLGLVAALGGWLQRPTRLRSFGAGAMAGLTLVIKPEFILAAGAVLMTAFLIRRRGDKSLRGSEVLMFSVGAVLPTALFFLYFARHLPIGEAAVAAGRAWTSVWIHSDMLGMKYQQVFMGLDQPWANVGLHVRKSFVALVVLVVFGCLTARALRWEGAARRGLLALVSVAALGVGLQFRVDYIGPCLLVLLLLYLVLRAWRRLPRSAESGAGDGETGNWRMLLAVLAVVLMARMFLSGRIVQFGFFQAAVATMVLGAIIFSEAAEWMPRVRGRRWGVALVAAALLVPGVVQSVALSQQLQRLQTSPVGTARDRFYSYPPDIDPTGLIVNGVVEALKKLPPGQTLLALPEGSMINYLARRPSPLPHFQYYGFTTEGGREMAIVKALEHRPPDIVVIASRDLRDFGISTYGTRDGAGRQIMQWIYLHYEITHQFDGDPLDSTQFGAYILQRKTIGAR